MRKWDLMKVCVLPIVFTMLIFCVLCHFYCLYIAATDNVQWTPSNVQEIEPVCCPAVGHNLTGATVSTGASPISLAN